MKKYFTIGLFVLALTSVVYADHFRDANGESPYVIAANVDGTWTFGIFGNPGYISGPIDAIEEFVRIDIAKYLLGERSDIRLSCVRNPKYKRELSLDESLRAERECEDFINEARRTNQNADWRFDFEKLDPSTESVLVEALQDSWRDLRISLGGQAVGPFDDEQRYYPWQNCMGEGLLKVGAGLVQLIKAPVKLATGVVAGVIGVVVLPFEEKGHLGDTVRRAMGLTVKSALDPVTGVLVIAQGAAGPTIYAAVTALGPVVVATKEGTSIVSELRDKIRQLKDK